jgi:RimJ/RimL family protein N-acetyltransferase
MADVPTPPELHLRSPVAGDYHTLASWIPDAQTCARWAGPRLAYPFAADALPQLLDLPGTEVASFCLSSIGSDMLGFCQFWQPAAGTIHLGRIIVSPAMRGQGLGKALCALLVRQAHQLSGIQKITLRVYRDNPAAQQVYTALGFAPVEALSSGELLFMERPASLALTDSSHG